MNNLVFLRNGCKSLKIFLRPHSTFRCSLTGGPASIARKSSVLFTNPQQQHQVQQAPTTTQTAQQNQQFNLLAKFIRSASSAASSHEHNHTTHWKLERLLSIALFAVIPGAFIIQSPVTDYLLAVSLVLHGYWGLQGIFNDYIHGKTLPKLAQAFLKVFTAVGFIGLCYFNYQDIGLTKAIQKIWAL